MTDSTTDVKNVTARQDGNNGTEYCLIDRLGDNCCTDDISEYNELESTDDGTQNYNFECPYTWTGIGSKYIF